MLCGRDVAWPILRLGDRSAVLVRRTGRPILVARRGRRSRRSSLPGGARSPAAGARIPPSPEQFIGFKVGADNKLARWDKIVEYMKRSRRQLRPRAPPRARQDQRRQLRSSSLEIASPETLKNLDRYKQLERKLYFQDGAPSAARARRDLPPGQGRRARHLQHPRERGRRHADVARARAPARDRRLAGGAGRSSTTSSSCSCRA